MEKIKKQEVFEISRTKLKDWLKITEDALYTKVLYSNEQNEMLKDAYTIRGQLLEDLRAELIELLLPAPF